MDSCVILWQFFATNETDAQLCNVQKVNHRKSRARCRNSHAQEWNHFKKCQPVSRITRNGLYKGSGKTTQPITEGYNLINRIYFFRCYQNTNPRFLLLKPLLRKAETLFIKWELFFYITTCLLFKIIFTNFNLWSLCLVFVSANFLQENDMQHLAMTLQLSFFYLSVRVNLHQRQRRHVKSWSRLYSLSLFFFKFIKAE